MEENIYKEVYFHTYCISCKYAEQAENEEPCDQCLEDCVNLYSHKPTKWEAAE